MLGLAKRRHGCDSLLNEDKDDLHTLPTQFRRIIGSSSKLCETISVVFFEVVAAKIFVAALLQGKPASKQFPFFLLLL